MGAEKEPLAVGFFEKMFIDVTFFFFFSFASFFNFDPPDKRYLFCQQQMCQAGGESDTEKWFLGGGL